MPIGYRCLQCKKTLQLPETYAGKKIKCGCGAIGQVNSLTRSSERPPARSTKPPAVATRSTSIFDELTEKDWSRTKPKPAADEEAVKSHASKRDPLKEYVSNDSSSINAAPGLPKSLMFLSIGHFLGAVGYTLLIFCLFVLAGIIQQVADQLPGFFVLGFGIIIGLVAIFIFLHAFIGIGYLTKLWPAWCAGVGLYAFNLIDSVFSAYLGFRQPEPEIAKLGVRLIISISTCLSVLNLMQSKAIVSHFRLAQGRRMAYWISFAVGAALSCVIGVIMVLQPSAEFTEDELQLDSPVETMPIEEI
jgi:hypothetical protein